MQITINSQQLAEKLRLVNCVVAAKVPLPILLNVLIRADLRGLQLAATDVELGFTTACAADVGEPGVVAVPAKRLLDLVEQMPNADVRIQTDKGHVHVLCGAFKSRLQAADPEDFPHLAEPTPPICDLPVALLHAAVSRVRYAIADSGKYTVNGSLLALNNGVAALVATDGKRLSVATMAMGAAPGVSVVVPAKALDVLRNLFSGPLVGFSHDDKHLFFVAGDNILRVRMLNAEFPKYERIIPRDHDKRANIDRAALSAALRRVGQLAEENQACNFMFEAGRLTVNSCSAGAGEATEQVAIAYDGPEARFCISWRFVLDFLEAAGEASVVLEFADDRRPLLMSDGTSFINVVMVMRA